MAEHKVTIETRAEGSYCVCQCKCGWMSTVGVERFKDVAAEAQRRADEHERLAPWRDGKSKD